MPATLTIRDETLGGASFREWSLEVLSERMTVRELIRSRVYQEVQDYNQRQPAEYHGLVQPTDAERTLNGYRLKKARQIDFREQLAKAIAAFGANQVLVLINDKQAESLDEEFDVAPGTEVSFLKLTLLVGG
ncbi:MAG TPA: hypothetical protein VFV87_16885 [Pirellulaceae bacterium]|nr:hypothetical protein [Pirellulaceae bacterium]